MRLEIIKSTVRARRLVLDVAERVGGSHIGGSFSIIDFLCTLYSHYLETGMVKDLELYEGKLNGLPQVIFSKGHCYLAQLAALDSVCGQTYYTDNYLKDGTFFFGHPKQNKESEHFVVSTGALGQGITFANGLSLANKRNSINRTTISIVGDGELNEGSCTEALLFAAHHKLNHTFIVDFNDQMSLGKTSEILNLGSLKERFYSYGLEFFEIDGHDIEQLTECVQLLLADSETPPVARIIILKTIKGKGVSFMEKDIKWHHRRFKNDEYQRAIDELSSTYEK